MPALKAGDNISVTRPRDVTVSVARDEFSKTPNTYCLSMMLRPALTEALKDAAQHVSRVGILEACAFVLEVVCSRFNVKSHEGHPSSGSDLNVTAAVETPHCKAKASQADSICKSATDMPGAKVIT